MYRLTSLFVTGALILMGSLGDAKCAPRARSFIYVVPDGYGQASQSMARDFESIISGQSTVKKPNSTQIGVDTMVIGSVRTQASDNLVTDSAASATAFGCGIKTYNGAIGVDNDGQPVGSILEAAFLSGFRTGLIATSRITHATPAAYCSHVLNRNSENDIASQQIGYNHPFGVFVDLLMGGGRQQYQTKKDGGKRTDNVDLISWAKEKGYSYVQDRAGMQDATKDGVLPLPFLGLFASSHMAYELDRDEAKEPSLLDMTKTALETLKDGSKGSKQGFFMMIEASRIDHAGHANDAAGHLHDTIMYNKVMAYVKEYVKANPDTQLLSAADHETGGLTLVSKWDPRLLAEPKHTSEFLVDQLAQYKGSDGKGYFTTEILPQYGLGNLTEARVNALWDTYKGSGGSSGKLAMAMGHESAAGVGINWSTGSHTSVDVTLYGYAAGKAIGGMKELIGGNRDNTELPKYVEQVLGVSLNNATGKLREKGTGYVVRRGSLQAIKDKANAAAMEHQHGEGHHREEEEDYEGVHFQVRVRTGV
ncbi:Alkaline phosphatase-like, alpha/beta/alpha [Beauveria brongniartii RCEF 3172]|uniref:Alkaline phosphatase n=1 Tax=Beauveria brongniartii RCEF 3172 TaxID=1081107 RepID=A0A167AU87_9HYPO|nr:Alkaline phosphatase-like, alpha/beta/alpha [Beauveria brongniartii RCEF 3172]